MLTGAEVVAAFRLSVATAVKVYEPCATPVQVKVNGAVVTVAMRLVPPWKKSTFWMVPSESDAVALSVILAGAVKLAPLAGLVKLTVGGTLGMKRRSARMWVLPTSALVAAVERLVPLAPAAACAWRVPVIDWPVALALPLGRSKDSVRPACGVQLCEEA